MDLDHEKFKKIVEEKYKRRHEKKFAEVFARSSKLDRLVEPPVFKISDEVASGMAAFYAGVKLSDISLTGYSLGLRLCVHEAINMSNFWIYKRTRIEQKVPKLIKYQSGEEFCLETYCKKTSKDNMVANMIILEPVIMSERVTYFFDKDGKLSDVHIGARLTFHKHSKIKWLRTLDVHGEIERIESIRLQIATILEIGTYLAKMCHQCSNPLKADTDKKRYSYRYCPLDSKGAESRVREYERKNPRIGVPVKLKDADRDSIIHTQEAYVELIRNIDYILTLLRHMELSDCEPFTDGNVWDLVVKFECDDAEYTHFLVEHGLVGYNRYVLIRPYTRFFENALLRHGTKLYRTDSAILCLNREGLWSLFYISDEKVEVKANYRQIDGFRNFVEQIMAAKVETPVINGEFSEHIRKTYDSDKKYLAILDTLREYVVPDKNEFLEAAKTRRLKKLRIKTLTNKGLIALSWKQALKAFQERTNSYKLDDNIISRVPSRFDQCSQL